MMNAARRSGLELALASAMEKARQGELRESHAALSKILKVHRKSVPTLQLMGAVATELGEYQQAVEHLRRAATIEPRSASVQFNLGKALRLAGRLQEALGCLSKAVQAAPNRAQTHVERGNVLLELNQRELALASYVRALELDPDMATAHFNSGVVLLWMDEPQPAQSAFERLLRLYPDAADGLFGKAYCQQRLCDWKGYDARIARLLDLAQSGQHCAGSTLFLTTVCDDNALISKNASAEFSRRAPRTTGSARPRRSKTRIAVAYVSCGSPSAELMTDLFEAHNRTHFDLLAVSLAPGGLALKLGQNDALVEAEDGRSGSLAKHLGEFGVDIAVDLINPPGHALSRVFLQRAAPIQVNFLSFPGPMGHAFEYIVADPVLATDEMRQQFGEKFVILPGLGLRARDPGPPREHVPSRAVAGLPDTGIVFSSFAEAPTLTPEIFALWMRVLRKVPGSVLWLLEASAAASANLRAEAARLGIDQARILFAPRVPREQQFDRLRLADLCLDTFPSGLGVAAGDALAAGLPVVTMAGNTLASRITASFLQARDQPDLVATSHEAYEAIAVRLAEEPARLNAVRDRLREKATNTRREDSQHLCRNLEHAYRAMMQNDLAGQDPVEIDLRPIGLAKEATS
jgi:protein O-GlcNAc transferase